MRLHAVFQCAYSCKCVSLLYVQLHRGVEVHIEHNRLAPSMHGDDGGLTFCIYVALDTSPACTVLGEGAVPPLFLFLTEFVKM